MKTNAKFTVPISALLFATMIMIPMRAAAQGGVPLWTNLYNGPGNGRDIARAIVLDRDGKVFITGTSPGETTPDDYTTMAYSSDGTPLWLNRFHEGILWNQAHSIAMDSHGNVFVTGNSYHPDVGCEVLATVAYSNAGEPLWTNRYDGPDDVYSAWGWDIALDNSDKVFVTGWARNGRNKDFLTLAYSNVGVPLWTNYYNGPLDGDDEAVAIVVDHSGTVFVTGTSYGSNECDYATLAYSNTGIPLWTNRYRWHKENRVYAMALDDSGSAAEPTKIFVTGYTAPMPGYWEFATVAYSSAGAPLWTNHYNEPGEDGNNAVADAIAVDRNGNVFVAGNVWVGPAEFFATVAYSGSGVPLWTNLYKEPADDQADADAIAVDSQGNIIVAGVSRHHMWADTWDLAALAYSNTGVSLWTNHFNGTGDGDDGAWGVVVDKNDDVIITGYSGEWGDCFSCLDFVTIKYSAVEPRHPCLKYHAVEAGLVLSWTDAAFSLQGAPKTSGPYTTILQATSPYTNSIADGQQFFRLKRN